MNAPLPAESLLEQIAERALDDDYYEVRGGDPSRLTPFVAALVILAMALMGTVAVLETRAQRSDHSLEQEALALDIRDGQKLLDTRQVIASALGREVDDLLAAAELNDPVTDEVHVLAADDEVTGSGLVVTLHPSAQGNTDGEISDRDLQILVNGLWYAGAEAVAVNGQRIGPLTSIRWAAGTIKVNYKPVSPPYRVEAIGDPEGLENRFGRTAAARHFESRHTDSALGVDVARSEDLTLDAAPAARLTVSHATAVEENDR